MIIRSEEIPAEERTGERNGTIIRLLNTQQMHGKNRLFARITLRPGARVPEHQHNDEFEVYYILSGSGMVNENGTMRSFKAGDVIFTGHLESHSLENTGDTDVDYIALITLL